MRLAGAHAIVGEADEKILRSQATDFHILKSCYKMWPSIGTSQAPIAAALSLRKETPADQIEKITVGLSDFGYDQQRDFLGEITTREQADHSVPYLVARAFLDGDVKVSDFEEQRYRDKQALALADKVHLEVDKSLNGEAEILGVKMAVTHTQRRRWSGRRALRARQRAEPPRRFQPRGEVPDECGGSARPRRRVTTPPKSSCRSIARAASTSCSRPSRRGAGLNRSADGISARLSPI